ncbi:autophagy-related protein [Suillus paluster]|uniref:autophagy-related protein n=1 Tax=Suillus paluster TaxID=48578 RepID=UPI001B872472|nr:autophagy-related protein [Suillus paluster]KAG1745428.1 autophagy-related protein [Suillus paluster]
MSAYGTTRHHGHQSTSSTPASTTLFRRLTWEGTVPLEIRVDSKELPANSDRGLECYYIQAPRVSYLPLLMPEIRRFLMDVVFDEAAGKMLKEEEWWFESEEGTLLKWHWPIGLIYDSHTICASIRPPSQTSTSHHNLQVTPLKLILHLASPPTEKLLLSPSAESCKQAFMGQLKEADFVRWGNTKRMTGLRKQDQDGIWEGIKEHNFDDYWRVASKIVPTTAPARSNSPPPSSNPSMHTRPASVDPQSAPDRDGAYNVRSVPVRLYLPDGPVMQDVVPPTLEDGSPHTLAHYLSTHLPLLFPPAPYSGPELAFSLMHGVLVPHDAEMAWLGACMSGADGWVSICVGIAR